MNTSIGVILFYSLVCMTVTEKTYIEGYYWRDFEGIIPKDAFVAGLDQSGEPIYIGQVLFENNLIPGKIYTNGSSVYFEYKGKAYAYTHNVKIFCTQTPEKFEWFPTKSDEIVKLTNKLIIKGGYEPDTYVYIGRVFTGGETSVGKVICFDKECWGLYIAKNEKGLEFNGAFEILIYKSEKVD